MNDGIAATAAAKRCPRLGYRSPCGVGGTLAVVSDDEVNRIGDLEIAHDLVFQRRTWAIQRIGWAAMGAVILAALLGYVAQGPLSDARAGGDGAYAVEYSRYSRHRAPDALRIVIAEGAVQGDRARVSIESEYLDGIEVESVYPEPESVEVGDHEIVYVFKLKEQGTRATVIFSVLHDDIGRKRARVQLDGHPPVSLSQFIYP